MPIQDWKHDAEPAPEKYQITTEYIQTAFEPVKITRWVLKKPSRWARLKAAVSRRYDSAEYGFRVLLDNLFFYRWHSFLARFDRKHWLPRFNSTDIWIMYLLVTEEIERQSNGIYLPDKERNLYHWDQLVELAEALFIICDEGRFQSAYDPIIAPGHSSGLTHQQLADLWRLTYEELRRNVNEETHRFDIDRIADTHEKVDALSSGFKVYQAVFNW